MEEGDNIILMMDGNEDMRQGSMKSALETLTLREYLLDKHKGPYKSAYRRNNKNVPIDGIWVSPSIVIKAGGYFEFDEVFQNTDHRTLWIDISYEMAFGHNMAPIVKPKARRLNCKDPRSVLQQTL